MTNWIDIKDWLPEPYEDVLVKVDTEDSIIPLRIQVAFMNEEEKWLIPIGDDLTHPVKNVTHWTLLPSI